MKRNVTIADVAKKAEVSTTTISRYLNGRYEFMSEDTRTKIETVIKELRYRPNNIARSMKAEKTHTIGCVVADIANPVSSILVKGINDICAERGYSVLFSDTNNDAKREKEGLRILMDNRVDGIIVNTTGKINDYLLSLEQRLPLVLADRAILDVDSIDAVITESYQTTYDCIAFLKSQGYQKVAFFSGPLEDISSRTMRHRGYMAAMEECYAMDGTPYTYIIDYNSPQSWDAAVRQFAKEQEHGPVAIFAVNGVALLTLLQSMNTVGIPVDGALGVCGFDDWGWSSLVGVGVTTIVQDSYNVGVQAAQLLIERIEGDDAYQRTCIELENKLQIRGSTSPKG